MFDMKTGLGIDKKILHAGKPPPQGSLNYPKETKFFFHYQICKTDTDKTVLDDTRKYGKPMELYSGKKFQLEVWELCLETMCVDEVSSFLVEKRHLTAFPPVNKKLRDYMLDKHDQGTAKHCCGMMSMKEQGGLGYPDLDDLMQNPEDLEFTFELIRVELPGETRKETWIMSPEEKLGVLPQLKEEGNRLYKDGQFPAAGDKYGQALDMLEQLLLREKPGEPEWQELDDAKIPYFLNLAQCKICQKDYYPAISHTNEVLERQPDNVKALFRRAKARAAVWDLDEAVKDFTRAAELDQSLSGAVAKELAAIERLRKDKLEEDKKRFAGKMFT